MSKTVTNDDFETALINRDNKLIMEKACNPFRQNMNADELYSCKLLALWGALQDWKPNGRKFTSFLYQKVHWECLKVIQKEKKHKFCNVLIDKEVHNPVDLDEILEKLPGDLQDIMIKRYVYCMTLREISKFYGCCHETIRRKICKSIKILKKHT